jgi:hypothetical protein
MQLLNLPRSGERGRVEVLLLDIYVRENDGGLW